MPGRLELICGPMFAGKSTELIRRLRAHADTSRMIRVFMPERDTRSGHGRLRTHAGDTLAATPIARAEEMLMALPAPTIPDGLVIALDEAHFFGPPLMDPVRRLLAQGACVIIAGVERDHRGRPFEPFPALLCEADDVTKLASRCAVCGGEAVHTQRLCDSDAPIVVGGAEAYEARCRRCFVPGR